MNKILILQDCEPLQMHLKKLFRTALFAAVSVTLVIGTTGCGRKGALTLPKQAQAITLNPSV